ncbi:TPA: hypothetical protein ACH3X1_013448 [Trebouxia sp. C0004]
MATSPSGDEVVRLMYFLTQLRASMAQEGSPDYAASIPCALWSNVLKNCSENCQLVFLLTLVGPHRQAALEIANQLWPAQTEQWAAQYVLRCGLAPKSAVSLPGRCTQGYLDLSSSQVLDVAKMQLFGWKLGVLHDRRDPKVIPSMTLNMSCRFSEQLAPAVCTACLLQISKAHTAKWPAHGFQLLQCPIDSRSLAGWHAHVTVARKGVIRSFWRNASSLLRKHCTKVRLVAGHSLQMDGVWLAFR